MVPGATNTWFLEILGTEGGVRFNTGEPKTFWVFERAQEQFWKRTDLGFVMPFKTITGTIFEVGFPDLIRQMWAALNSKFSRSAGHSSQHQARGWF